MEKSPFFQKCLSSGMIEQQTNKVNLPEDSSRAFEFVANWLYSTSINGAGKNWEECEIYLIMRAWVLADKYCMPDLQNALIDGLGYYWVRCFVHPYNLAWVAYHTHRESPLYRLVMDQLAHHLRHYGFQYGNDNSHPLKPAKPGREDRSKALTKVLSRPDLSTILLWKTIDAPELGQIPAKSPKNYHVPTDPQTGGTTSTNARKRKRRAYDNTEAPEVAPKVTRQS
jgi:hypothetical protein